MLASVIVFVVGQTLACPRGWQALSTPACLHEGTSPGVVVYLHGMMAPTDQQFARELSFITPAATRASMTVIAVRGVAGLCDWSKDTTSWWCWPSVRTRERETAEALERISAAVSEAEQRLSRPLPSPLLAGYSNGGYFTSIVMERPFPVTGYAILHGGLVSGVTIGERPRPVLLVAAEGDTIQRPAMETFRATLEQRLWTPAFTLRKKAHPLELEDFDVLMRFARRLSWQPRARP